METCIICELSYPSDELVDGICVQCDMDADWMEGYDEWLDDLDEEYND